MTELVILHLMNGFKNASIGQIVKQLVKSIGGKNYKWFIGGLSNMGEMHEEFRRLGITLVDFSNSGDMQGNLVQRVRRYLSENQIQVIHSHTIRSLLIAWMATRRLPPTPYKHVYHVATKHTLTAPMDRNWGVFYSLIDHLALYLPDYLIPVSQIMRKNILAQPWIKPERVYTIPNAIPCNEWYTPEKRDECRQEMGITPDAVVIGFGGRFEPVKRLDLLLDAFTGVSHIYHNARLVLAGEGSLRHQLEQQASRLGISEAIIWTGFCQDMPRVLSALDIYVQPSVNEGLSLSILEAMAAGIPVIATRVGGNVETITDAKDGILIPPLSPQSIQSSLLDLIEHPDKRHQIAVNARKKVHAIYGLERMVEGYRHFYENILI